MKVSRFFCATICAITAEAATGAAIPAEAGGPPALRQRVVLDAPGHVCLEGQGTFARGGEPGAAWTLLDWRGRETGHSGVFDEEGVAAIPPLPTGYYRMAPSFATLAVVPPLASRVFDHDSFYAVDSAQGMLLPKEKFLCPWNGGDKYRTVSDLIALAGVPHVRDRFGAASVYRERGPATNFLHHMRNAELLRERRILSSNTMYGFPRWTTPRHGAPTDLAAVRDLCARAAADFGHCLGDFEFMNEPDGSIPVWDYAAAMKAACLGFRAGAPEMPVVPAGLTDMGGRTLLRTLFDNDAAKFFDVFNIHTYKTTSAYPDLVGRMRECLADYGFSDQAIWLTEVGTNMEGHSRKDGVVPGLKAHSPEQELIVAEFLPKAFTALQMAGVARAYWFVFCPYNERGGDKDWGMMRRDGTVKPVYAAMSAMTRELVSAKLVGEINVGEGSKAFLFDQPDGSQTVAFWTVSPVDLGVGEGISPEPDFARTVQLALPKVASRGDISYRLSDMCGMISEVAEANGVIALPATRFPAYVSGLRGLVADIPAKPAGRVAPYIPAPNEDLSIIIRAELDEQDFTLTRNKTRASLKADTGRLRVIAWNLGDTAKTGTVEIAGGRLEGLPAEPFALGPSESAAFDCTFVPEEGGDFDGELVLFGRFNGKMGSRLAIPFWLDKRFLAICEEVPLAWTNMASWERNDSAQKSKTSWDEAEKAVRFDLEWTGNDNRWCYPWYHLADGETLYGARMLSFEVKSAQDKVENDHHCSYVMLGGNLAYAPPNGNWERRYVELSTEAKAAGVREFRIGVNPNGHRLTLWIRNVSALK